MAGSKKNKATTSSGATKRKKRQLPQIPANQVSPTNSKTDQQEETKENDKTTKTAKTKTTKTQQGLAEQASGSHHYQNHQQHTGTTENITNLGAEPHYDDVYYEERFYDTNADIADNGDNDSHPYYENYGFNDDGTAYYNATTDDQPNGNDRGDGSNPVYENFEDGNQYENYDEFYDPNLYVNTADVADGVELNNDLYDEPHPEDGDLTYENYNEWQENEQQQFYDNFDGNDSGDSNGNVNGTSAPYDDVVENYDEVEQGNLDEWAGDEGGFYDEYGMWVDDPYYEVFRGDNAAEDCDVNDQDFGNDYNDLYDDDNGKNGNINERFGFLDGDGDIDDDVFEQNEGDQDNNVNNDGDDDDGSTAKKKKKKKKKKRKKNPFGIKLKKTGTENNDKQVVHSTQIVDGNVVAFRCIQTQTDGGNYKKKMVDKAVDTSTPDEVDDASITISRSLGELQQSEIPVTTEDGHVVSRMLYDDECQAILRDLHEDLKCIAMSIAQLWFLDVRDEWQLELTGAVCVLKNFREKNHSVLILELQTFEVMYTFKISHMMRYKILNEAFHTFLDSEGDQYGFIFVDIEEADFLGNIVKKKAKKLKTKYKEKQKLEMKKTTVALNFVSKLKKKILKKNHIELSESEAYPMRPFVPNIGFVELMDSLDQPAVYETIIDNKRKKGLVGDTDIINLPQPPAALLDFSNYDPINFFQNPGNVAQQHKDTFPPPPPPFHLSNPPHMASPRFQIPGLQSQITSSQSPQAMIFTRPPPPPPPPLGTINKNNLLTSNQHHQNLSQSQQPPAGHKPSARRNNVQNVELLQSIRQGKQLRKIGAPVKERVVQLKLSKQVEDTLQKAHNLRSQAWFQNQISGIREHTILSSDEDGADDWSEDDWDK